MVVERLGDHIDESSVKRDLRAVPPDYAAVPADMKKWVYSGGQYLCGLYRRRVNEGNLFRTGSYAMTSPACRDAAGAGALGALSAGPHAPQALRPSVAPGTQPEEVLTLRARGVPHLRGTGRGDLHVHLKVQVPTRLDSAQEKLLRDLAAARGEERPGISGKGGLFGRRKR